MASAQVLPTSRKQEHLEAGKRRLEEFRRKKAADRAKKAATTTKPNVSDVGIDQKQQAESDSAWITNSDGAGMSAEPAGNLENFGVSVANDNIIDSAKTIEQNPLKDVDVKPQSIGDYSTSITVQNHVKNHDFSTHGSTGFTRATPVGQEKNEVNNNHEVYSGSEVGLQHGILADNSVQIHTETGQGFDKSDNKKYILSGTDFLNSKENNYTLTQEVDSIHSLSDWRASNLEAKQEGSTSFQSTDLTFSAFGGRNSNSTASSFANMLGEALHSESKGFDSGVRSSANNVSMFSGTSQASSRRSRPSFLDSLNVPKDSSGYSIQSSEPEKNLLMPNTSDPNGSDFLGSSIFQKPPMGSTPENSTGFSVPNGVTQLGFNVNDSIMDQKPDSYSSKQNDDFAALEQHIEDLTQEKFSLQRALEASRALAESLAGENSSLTDNYNQQRITVNQLKSDMASLQQEIKAHLVELESVKVEYANAQLECNAADERAKLLASEVINLEEKALRLRSNELKLERQLEDAQVEMNSYKKKISSLEKDRQDLHSTIEALQEEKKLLQSKLRKASASGKSLDVTINPTNRKETSTSTDDLDAIPGTSNQGSGGPTSVSESDTTGLPLLTESGQLNLEFASMHIPPEQMRLIQNINTLISELALEKDELIQALQSESSECFKLKELNKELTRKLEMQTQRLELLTAKSMANENTPAKSPDSRNVVYNAAYADEGDEVVERVLGWIMKLFPGGPAKRRTSKLL